MNTSNSYHHGNLHNDILARGAEIIDEQGLDALSLRGIARDLGVSHAAPNRHFKNKAALLSALATDGWLKLKEATLSAANAAASQDPRARLNAMGRGYLHWALDNRALFRSIMHPDVTRTADEALLAAIQEFANAVRAEVHACQQVGHLSDLPLDTAALFTNAVPTGAAILLAEPILRSSSTVDTTQIDTLVEQLIALVVPTDSPE